MSLELLGFLPARLLGRAVVSGHLDTVIALLDARASIEAPGHDGHRPLMLAALAGQQGALYILLNRGAEVNATVAESGNTALMLAANRGRLEVVRMLLQAGADPGLEAKDGWTAGQAARMAGHADIAKLLDEQI